MASAGRIVVVAAPPAAPTLGQSGVPLRLSSARANRLNSARQVQKGCVHCAYTTSQTRNLYQEAKVPSCNRLRLEQVTTLLKAVVGLTITTLVSAMLINVEATVAVEGLGLDPGAAFQRTCAGCHSGGGNIIQPAATLSKKDLDKNGLITVDDIYNITYSGKNRMPGYGEKCTPRGQCTFGPRLSEEDIRALAEFVKLQADKGWAKVPY